MLSKSIIKKLTVASIVGLFSTIFIVTSFTSRYSPKDKVFKMLYMVKSQERISDVALRFNADPIEIKRLNSCGEYVSEGTILKIPAVLR
jgi:hypothetical protein